jgi:4-amino-4-deoxy-L-arabinose transferase-like glycosyltransferase
MKAAIGIIAIAGIIALLALYRLGAADVCSGNEAVEGVFIQQMVEHGEYLFPLENGGIPMYKPPLFHWTATALAKIARVRTVDAMTVRMPSAVYAIAGAVITMLFALWLLGVDGAILAGLTLAGSYQYVSQARFGRVDMTLAFFETLALLAFVWWLPRDSSAPATDAAVVARRNRLYALAIAMGLAVLAKGPVGALLPGLAMLIFMIAERRARQIAALLEPGPAIVGLAIASSWYIACYAGGRYAFLHRQLGAENVGRFFGRLGAMAPWYYAVPLLLNSAPLSLLVPIAVAFAIVARPAESAGPVEASSDETARRAVRCFAIFWIVTVVFFSLAAYKRRAYLLPLWPAAAVMLAWWIKRSDARRWGAAIKWGYGAMCAALIVFNFIYIPRKEIRDCAADTFRPAAREIARVVSPAEPLYLFGFREEVAPLLFYLDRDAPVIEGRLGDAPPGYVLMPAAVWKAHENEALDLSPVLTSDYGDRHLVLLRRGKAYARRSEPCARNECALADRHIRGERGIDQISGRIRIVARCLGEESLPFGVGLHFLQPLAERLPVGRFDHDQHARCIFSYDLIQHAHARAEAFEYFLGLRHVAQKFLLSAWARFPGPSLYNGHR